MWRAAIGGSFCHRSAITRPAIHGHTVHARCAGARIGFVLMIGMVLGLGYATNAATATASI
jgi:hypothetical protein